MDEEITTQDGGGYVTQLQFYTGLQEMKTDTIAEVRRDAATDTSLAADFVGTARVSVIAITVSIVVMAVSYAVKSLRRQDGEND